jgi:hypothetical protein
MTDPTDPTDPLGTCACAVEEALASLSERGWLRPEHAPLVADLRVLADAVDSGKANAALHKEYRITFTTLIDAVTPEPPPLPTDDELEQAKMDELLAELRGDHEQGAA